MSAEIHYSDLFLISILPIILQGIAGFYVLKIWKYIGKQMAVLLGVINGVLFWNNITIGYVLLIAAQRPQQQPIEAWGLFIGFGMPLAVAAMLLLLQRSLAKVFTGRNNG